MRNRQATAPARLGANLRHTARIGALVALLLLLQACGGGGGNPPMLTENDCTGTTPILQNNMCVRATSNAECLDRNATTPIRNTNGSCRQRQASDCTDDAMPFFDSSDRTCKVAGDASQCPDARPVFMTDGSCRARGAGGGTTAISLDGTVVVFEEAITTAQTNAYDEIRDAARNTSTTTTQSGNCGSQTCTDGNTQGRVGIDTSTGTGGNLVLNGVFIDKDSGSPTDYLLDQGTGAMTFMGGRSNTATDRRFRPSEGLDGWNYRRYALTGTGRRGDTSEATGDFILWADPTDTYYFAGGVWAYDIGEDSETRGAGLIFDGGNDLISTGDPFPAADSGVADARYVGHSFGYYVTLPAPAGETENRGYFAANVRLDVSFDDQEVSGTISNFLFSEDKDFETASPLETALSGLEVTLGATSILMSVFAIFTGDTSAEVEVDGNALNLTGKYGGRLFGPQGTTSLPEAPLAIGGTWGAAGATMNDTIPTTANGGFGIAFIGSFGVKRCTDDTFIVIGNTCVSFEANTAITDAHTAAYNQIFVAARNTSNGALQSGNCGSPSCTPGQTQGRFGINASTGTGGARMLGGVFIDGDSSSPVDDTLEENTDEIPALTRGASAADRRFRPSANGGLDGWNYRRYALTDDATPDDVTATADLIVWVDTTDAYYLAGGVFAYDIDEEEPTNETRGAGLVQTEIVTIDGVFPAADSGVANATYTGHSFGYYTTLPAPDGEENRGYFAANASLEVDFSDTSGGVSGTIDNFLFSEDKGFTDTGKSALEDALSGLSVSLEAGSISGSIVVFRGDTSASIMVGTTSLMLTGKYGGAFFRDQETQEVDPDERTPLAPLGIGGTWGAAGVTSSTPADGGFGIAFIGSFGARRVPAIPSITFDSALADPNHARYVAISAASNRPLFANGQGSGTASSVTLGSAIGNHDNDDGTTPERTNDRVYLLSNTLGDAPNQTRSVQFVVIDVGNDVDGVPDITSTLANNVFLTNAAAMNDNRGGQTGTRDRRTGTGLGWDYRTATLARGEDVNEVDEFEAFVVDWSSDTANYMGGGVWARVVRVDVNGNAELEVGAFVDGDNPTGGSAVRAATDSATYQGHAYGRYSLNRGITGDANPGFFAAKATLNADFGTSSEDGTISGRIHNFLFSKDNTFTTAQESALETAIGGANQFFVTLQQAGISSTGNRFNNVADTSGIRLPDGEILNPVGRWGGRFYGDPDSTDNDRPQVVGGVFSVSDETATADGSVSFSIIGSFGARRTTP